VAQPLDRKMLDMDIKLELEARIAKMHSILDANSKDMGKHVIPIFIPDDKGNPRILGSGVLLAIQERHFLVSAAHVFDENEMNSTLYYPQGESLAILQGQVHKTQCDCRENDKVDIGFMELDSNSVENMPEPLEFLSKDDLSLDDKPASGKLYVASGFPYTTNKGIAYKDRAALTLRPTMLCHTTTPADSKTCAEMEKHGFACDKNIFLKYDRKNTADKNHEKKMAPSPTGVSGGGLWLSIDMPNKKYKKKLVGIGIEFLEKHNVIIGTRIELVLRGIRQVFPDLQKNIL
jgi:hypothetical protein